jgi:acetylornithine deacetylase/succinyl-diaminopimelate desuccinylase-like protein
VTVVNPDDDVVALCSDLIRFDTSNRGEGSGAERPAAEFVAAHLAGMGLEPVILEPPGQRGRTSVVTRVSGSDPSRPALLFHGHLDVVPAVASDWSVPPFSGEVRDGYVWGRGAVDMKNMNAMVLAALRDMLSHGVAPVRDLVLAFVADEEAGGAYGAKFLVDSHPDLFDGCTEAIGEVGGFSYTVSDSLRLYLIETAERGISWLRLTARGSAGHASMLVDDGAVHELAKAVARVGALRSPVQLTGTARRFLQELSDALGVPYDENDADALIARLGPLARMVGAAVRNTANATQFHAGDKTNVVPAEAWATVDCRFVPGQGEQWERELVELAGPAVAHEWTLRLPAVETSFDGALVDALSQALRCEDPIARPIPYVLSAGSDAKSFARLGIKCVGACPLRLPPELDFPSLFHAADERIPVDALRFGTRVLRRVFTEDFTPGDG